MTIVEVSKNNIFLSNIVIFSIFLIWSTVLSTFYASCQASVAKLIALLSSTVSGTFIRIDISVLVNYFGTF